jgi:GTPase SAR1 family protein
MSKIIIGNKCDCKDSERQVSESEGKRFAQTVGIQFIETSAKENTNIENIFQMIGNQIKEKLLTSEE